jgi:hypothetical protein
MDDNRVMSDSLRDPHPAPLVLVLGMHRSGTSALTGLLSLAGLSAGDTLIASHRDNPRGYFEHPGIVAAHDALLAALGRRWDDPRAFPADWLGSSAARSAEASLVALVEALAPAGRIPLVKDPRACRFVPLWRRVAERCGLELRVVFALRDPTEVRASLGARDRLPAARADQLWLAHVLEAERASRGLKRVAVGFDAALADPAALLADVASGLDLTLDVEPEALGRFMDAGLRHHHASTDAPVDGLAQEAFNALRGTRLPDAAVMDGLWQRFERERAIYAAGVEERWRGDHAASTLVATTDRGAAGLADALAMVATLATLSASSHAAEVPDPRLYVATADGAFDEGDSLVAAMDPSGRGFRARFDLPAGRVAERVRFDPAQRAGVYVLEKMLLDGCEVDLPARARPVGGQALGMAEGIGLAATDDDPHWTIDLRLLPAAGARVEVFFRVESLGALLGAIGMPGRLASIDSGLASAGTGLASVGARLAALEASVLARFAALDAANHERVAAIAERIVAFEQRMEAATHENAQRHAEGARRQDDLARQQEQQAAALSKQGAAMLEHGATLDRLERRSALAHEWRRLLAWLGGGRR